MPVRLAEDVRKVLLTAATQEASRRGDRRIGTDHLLLGLLHLADSRAAGSLEVTLEAARTAADDLDLAALAAVGIEVSAVGRPPGTAPGRRLQPFSSGARAVLADAVNRARQDGGKRVDAGHFLLALLSRERPDPAAELLHALAVDPAAVRARLRGRE